MGRLFLFALLFTSVSLFAQTPAVDSAWLVNNYTKREVYITMRDGVKLYTIIYEPTARGKHPILINRTPYSIAPYGEGIYKAVWNNHYMNYFRENYIMVMQDVRGKFMSEGEFMDVRPFNPKLHNLPGRPPAPTKTKDIDEATDTYDAIDWLVKNTKNNNGRAGIYGISYPGFYAAMGAMCGHPALKASSPQAPVTEWFKGDDFHHNGVFMMMDAFNFYSSFGKPRRQITTKYATGYQYTTNDNYQFYLSMGAIKNLATAIGDSISFWKDLYNHPNYDQFWQVRNTRKFTQYISPGVATLVVGGLFDAEDCFGAWSLYKSIENKADNNNKIVMGPWSHGGWARGSGEYLGNVRFGLKNSEYYQKNIEIPFFNYYLQGKGNSYSIPEASIFFSGANKWRKFSQWPPAGEKVKAIYLHADGALSYSAPTENGNLYRKYTSDPAKPVPYAEGVHMGRTNEYMTDDQRFAARRPDVLVYSTDTLKEDITLAGPLVADLYASISTTDADFVVKLIDVFPDNFTYNDSVDGKGNGKPYTMGGYQMMVRGEIMRGRYRNSFENPEAFTPNAITEVEYRLPDVAHVFKKGHRIMVQVQSTWFPLADRNPQQFVNIYTSENSAFIASDIKIWCDKDHPSRILLPVLR